MDSSERQSTDFERRRKAWNERARSDALGSICTGRGPSGAWTREDFFKSGTQEVDLLLGYLSRLGVSPHLDKALDFGCGVGRLSRALALHFGSVLGVDVSDEMVRQATDLNRDKPNLRFVVNARDDLRAFEGGSFDFVLSDIVLQHVHTAESRRYVSEFIRLLGDSGIAVFQLPGPVTRRGIATGAAARRGLSHNGLDPKEVQEIVEKAGGTIRASLSSPRSYLSLL